MIPLNKLRSSKGYGQNLAAINVNLIEDDWAKLRRYADLLGTSAAEIVRGLITDYIASELKNTQEKIAELQENKERLLLYMKSENIIDNDQLQVLNKQLKALESAISSAEIAIITLRSIE